MYDILLIEDSKDIYYMVDQSINAIANLTWSKTVEDAQSQVLKKKFDLIIIDIGLPDGNGLQLCSSFQSRFARTPIFILTGEHDLAQKVLGFSAGADDYITKPFELLELRARISAKLHKNDQISESLETLKWKELMINSNRHEVTIFNESESTNADLTALEFKILLFFAHRTENVLTRDVILDGIWGENTYVNHRTVDTHMSKLRKKLHSASDTIKSVHGKGYKFSPTNI